MEDSRRWVVAIVAALAIIGLLLFARGEPAHGDPATPSAVVTSARTV
jgi:hypothetical protein